MTNTCDGVDEENHFGEWWKIIHKKHYQSSKRFDAIMTHTTPYGSGTMYDLAGSNARGVGTAVGRLHSAKCLRKRRISVWHCTTSSKHASNFGFPRSAPSACSHTDSFSVSMARRFCSCCMRQASERVHPEANVWTERVSSNTCMWVIQIHSKWIQRISSSFKIPHEVF
jgi:hypothetical protein